VREPTAPADATASLGSLSTPVVGITSSMLMFGERPTTEDMIGFALIFAVAACALTQPAQRTVTQAP
jgi:drug/metabolite transporter (DMT)-like permease